MEVILKVLESLPSLRRFHLRNCDLTESKKEVMELFVQNLPGIRNLGIARNQLRVALDPFLLASGTELSLDTSQNGITEDFPGFIAGCKVRLDPFLDCLGFCRCELNSISWRSLARGLRRMGSSLTQLDLSRNSIGDKEATTLASTLATHHKALKSLKLCDNGIRYGGVVALANGLIENLGFLECLDLSMNIIGDDGAVALGYAFATTRKSSLKFLDLSYNKIDSQGLIVLVENLKSIKFLGLSGNYFGDDGAATLGIAFTRNHEASIDVLNLSFNRIGVRGATKFANALADSHKPIKQLNLGFNDISNEGAMAIANALCGNQFIESLHLSGNGIESEGALALGDALTRNQFLKDLDLSHNQVKDEGTLAIANALKHNKYLTHLGLAENSIGDVGAVGLADMLRSNSVLVCLYLRGNKNLTEKGRESLGCAMHQNRVLEFLQLPYGAYGCPWSRCVEFFTGCNGFRIWDVIRNENAMIPWHQAFFVLLNGRFGLCALEESFSHRLSAVFLLLRSRPDVVKWDMGSQEANPLEYDAAKCVRDAR